MELDSQENPGEIKRREVELDPQESPGEIKSREVELDLQESPGEIKRREVELDPQENPGEVKGREPELGSHSRMECLAAELFLNTCFSDAAFVTSLRTAVETAISEVLAGPTACYMGAHVKYPTTMQRSIIVSP